MSSVLASSVMLTCKRTFSIRLCKSGFSDWSLSIVVCVIFPTIVFSLEQTLNNASQINDDVLPFSKELKIWTNSPAVKDRRLSNLKST